MSRLVIHNFVHRLPARDVIHPDWSKVKHIAAVQEAARKYREAVKANRGTYENGGRAQKEAEENLNRVGEGVIPPLDATHTEMLRRTGLLNRRSDKLRSRLRQTQALLGAMR